MIKSEETKDRKTERKKDGQSQQMDLVEPDVVYNNTQKTWSAISNVIESTYYP